MRHSSGIVTALRGAFLACAAVLLPASAFAAGTNNLAEDILKDTTSSLVNLKDSVVTFLQVAFGIASMVALALVVYEIVKGEREAAQKFGKWFAGIALFFVVLSVLASRITGV